MWIEKETTIAEIKTLLDNGYEIEVDSPDGYVPVNFFINKGMYDEYVLRINGIDELIRCNADHLFSHIRMVMPLLHLFSFQYPLKTRIVAQGIPRWIDAKQRNRKVAGNGH